jgi:large subunit ribosomal protein L15e
VGEDGKSVWYEVILADRSHPAVLADKKTARMVTAGRGRAFRGLTSAGKKSRGLAHKGKKG